MNLLHGEEGRTIWKSDTTKFATSSPHPMRPTGLLQGENNIIPQLAQDAQNVLRI